MSRSVFRGGTAAYLCTDATGVLVQAKERCLHGHFWVLVMPERHVLFMYSSSHDKAAVDKLLSGYKGFLVADAHSVYDHLYLNGDIIEVGCWAHGRRYFFKSLPTDPDRAKVALSHIAALFQIEREIAKESKEQRELVRHSKSRPIVDDFFGWCRTERDRVLDQTPICTALGYALNQEQALRRFLLDGRLPLHNNSSELNLRRQVVGRHNWLFVGSEVGAEANTTFVSLLASCRMHQLEPVSYIRDLLCLLPRWPKSRVLELAPALWRQTLQKPETQQLLGANLFRQVVLGLRS